MILSKVHWLLFIRLSVVRIFNPSVEEKGANLLYFVIKDHSFLDGNKCIAAFLFVWFLEKNKILYRSDGSKRIADNALVALTLMIAESKPEEKDMMIKVGKSDQCKKLEVCFPFFHVVTICDHMEKWKVLSVRCQGQQNSL